MTIEEFGKYAKFGTRKTRKKIKDQLRRKYNRKQWHGGKNDSGVKFRYLTGFDNTFKTIEIEKSFGIDYIEDGAFKNSLAEKIVIADGVNMYGMRVSDNTSISGWRTYLAPDEIFSGCKNLKQVKLPYVAANKYDISAKVYSIGYHNFFECTSLEEVEIPPCVGVISGGSFENCTNLKKVELPITVQTIGYRAFKGCDSLKTVKVPEDCYVDSSAFPSGCTVERYKVTEKEIEELLQQWNEDKFPERFPKKLKPRQLTPEEIAREKERKKQQEKEAAKREAERKARWNFDYKIEEIDGERVITKVGDKLPKDAVVPDTVTEIAPRAFSGAENLRTIVIPESVKKIGNSAFAKCNRLREVTLPEGLTEIARSTFADCPQLMKVNYPSTLIKICERAFYGCPKLQSPKLPSGLKRIEEYAFYPLSVQKLHIPYNCKCAPRASNASIVVGYEEIPLARYVEQQKEDRRYREEQREIDRITLARLAEQQRNAATEPQKSASSANSSAQSDAPFAFVDMWDAPQAFKDFMRQGYIYMQDESYWGAIDQFQKALKVRRVSDELKQYAQFKLDEATAAKDKQKKEEDERKYKEAVEERIREMKRREEEEKAAAERAKREAEERAKREKEAGRPAASQTSAPTKSAATSSSTVPSVSIVKVLRDYMPDDDSPLSKAFWRALDQVLNGKFEKWATLGEYFATGYGCKKNELYAVLCYEKSKWKYLDVEAFLLVADVYFSGVLVTRDIAKAFKYYNGAFSLDCDEGGEQSELIKGAIDKILAEDPSLAPKSKSGGRPTMGYFDFYQKATSEMRKTLDPFSVYFDTDYSLSELVKKYPDELSYIPKITFKISAREESITSHLGTRGSNYDDFIATVRRLGLEDALNNWPSDSQVRWTDGRYIEVGQLRAKQSQAMRYDSGGKSLRAENSFKYYVEQAIDDAWDECTEKYAIVNDKGYIIKNYGVAFNITKK